MKVKVKVCGITSFEDAMLALDHGADALGFNFHRPSPRFIEPAAVRDIVRRLPPFATTVGVFVNVANPFHVEDAASAAGIHVIQLHGNESADYCRVFEAWPLIKAVHVGSHWNPASIKGFPAQAFLFDTKDEHLFGGTGQAFDWDLLRGVASSVRVILAGGLNPGNAAKAVRLVRPYAVDVCSGVEKVPGNKDPLKMKAFMDEVFNAIK